MLTAYAKATGNTHEVTMLLTPEPGVDIYTALRDARLSGYRRIVVHPDNTATVVVYEEDTDA